MWLKENKWYESGRKGHDDHNLASGFDNPDHPSSVGVYKSWLAVVSVVLPDLDCILLEIILNLPLFTLELNTDSLLVSWESLMNVHSDEKG